MQTSSSDSGRSSSAAANSVLYSSLLWRAAGMQRNTPTCDHHMFFPGLFEPESRLKNAPSDTTDPHAKRARLASGAPAPRPGGGYGLREAAQPQQSAAASGGCYYDESPPGTPAHSGRDSGETPWGRGWGAGGGPGRGGGRWQQGKQRSSDSGAWPGASETVLGVTLPLPSDAKGRRSARRRAPGERLLHTLNLYGLREEAGATLAAALHTAQQQQQPAVHPPAEPEGDAEMADAPVQQPQHQQQAEQPQQQQQAEQPQAAEPEAQASPASTEQAVKGASPAREQPAPNACTAKQQQQQHALVHSDHSDLTMHDDLSPAAAPPPAAPLQSWQSGNSTDGDSQGHEHGNPKQQEASGGKVKAAAAPCAAGCAPLVAAAVGAGGESSA